MIGPSVHPAVDLCADGEVPGEPAGPMRTCIGCRRVSPISDLFRLIVLGGVLYPDLRRRLPGRGAWLHPDEGCVDLAERRRTFVRALRLDGPPDIAAIRAHLHPQAAQVELPYQTSGSTAARKAGRPHMSTP